ncbi:MAG: diguanylate cyclase [Clostridiales bacterium]|nr:diguanylate cyclase [Clostridiales bacterium]
MRHIKAKITLIIIVAIVLSMGIVTLLSMNSIKRLGQEDSEHILLLLCETGQKNLDSYFVSVEKSVGLIASYVENDLADTEIEDLPDHVDRVRDIFEDIAVQTNGVLTYYYRIDPEVSSDTSGFWYVDTDGTGFVEHEVTDISEYDTTDTSDLVWFTVPKVTGEPVWLPPYETENLNVYVLSYNIPVYKAGEFIGVIGIEIDYSTMANQVDNIRLYDTGYAFIIDKEGGIIYHPFIDTLAMTDDEIPQVPDGMLSEGVNTRYIFEGVEKQGVCLPLHNGMKLTVSVPVDEINGNWESLVSKTVYASVFILFIFVLVAMYVSDTITRPLRELTKAAQKVGAGDYDIEITHQSNDEVGILARTFEDLVNNLKTYIARLKEDNAKLEEATVRDSLTGARNRFALRRDYDSYIDKDIHLLMFDIDDFKKINDGYGHAIGDYLLKKTSDALVNNFGKESVYRYGGDEFLVITDSYNEKEYKKVLANLTNELNIISLEDQQLPVHYSAGYVYGKLSLQEDLRLMLRQADELLYEAKGNGKNTFIGKEYDREYADSIKKKAEEAFRHY